MGKRFLPQLRPPRPVKPQPPLPNFSDMIDLACTRRGVRPVQLAKLLLPTANPKLLRDICKFIRKNYRYTTFPMILKLGRMAGLPDAEIATIWCQQKLPAEYAHLRQYVGCTVRRYRHKESAGDQAVREEIRSRIPYARP